MRLLVLGSAVLLVACPRSTSEVDAAVLDSGTDASVEVVDAGPPLPATLEPQVIASQKDGGTAAITANANLDEVAALTISMPIKLKDFRIRLMDWQDKIVVSDDELLADGKTYLLTPSEPLKAGRSYTLKLDADLGVIVTDETGGTWNDWELPFRMSGEAVPEPSAKKPGKKKK